jgi:hypothetical protein
MLHEVVTARIIEAAMKVHTELGAGLLKSTYSACLYYQMAEDGLHFEYQARQPVTRPISVRESAVSFSGNRGYQTETRERSTLSIEPPDWTLALRNITQNATTKNPVQESALCGGASRLLPLPPLLPFGPHVSATPLRVRYPSSTKSTPSRPMLRNFW